MRISKKKLDIAIANAGITKKELAKKSGVNACIIASIAKQSRTPKTVGKIAKALSCNVTDLLEDEPESQD